MCDIFQTRGIRYNLKSQTEFGGYCVNTNRFGLNSLKFFAANYGILCLQKLKILIVWRFLKAKFENGNQTVLATFAKRT